MSNIEKHFYNFGLGQISKETEITQEMKDLLGGKGAGLSVMSNLGFNVPPGVTVSTDISKVFSTFDESFDEMEKKTAIIAELSHIAVRKVSHIKEHFGYQPMYAVRSGAPVSMPGMMDTVLNVGISRNNMNEWADRIGEKAAWDCYVRLLMTIATSIFECSDKEISEIEKRACKFKYGLKEQPKGYSFFNEKHLSKFATYLEKHLDSKTSLSSLNFFHHIMNLYAEKVPYKDVSFTNFINNKDNFFYNQLCLTMMAVLQSWNSDRAIAYRKINNLENISGTAINIQSMVFGNYNDSSCSGVLFTRNPTTGEDVITGEYLVNAQGEDVVSGSRTPDDIKKMKEVMPDVYSELVNESKRLEESFKDMMDIEFTVQDGELFFLQCRSGKRSTKAKFVIATDLLKKNVVSKEDFKSLINIKDIEKMVMPSISDKYVNNYFSKGTPASGGVVKGVVALSSNKAVELSKKHSNVILFAFTTTPDDIAGINASSGIVTQIGGVTSHAAVVARGMDKNCIVGVGDMEHTIDSCEFDSGVKLVEGQEVVIDGSTGYIYQPEDVEISEGKLPDEISDIFYDNANKIDGFYLNVNDKYLDTIDFSRVNGKVVIKIKPHNIDKDIIKHIEYASEKLGRKNLTLDATLLNMQDHIQCTAISKILQIDGLKSYHKQNLMKFNDIMEKFSKKTKKDARVDVIIGDKKMTYNVKVEGKNREASIEVSNKKSSIADYEHFENTIFS